MIHFNNTTGKNAGKLQVTKLANFLGLNEATLRSLKRTNPAKFEREHLGALCQANNINAEILETFIKDLVIKSKSGEIITLG
jgi:DNA-binding Xre family transcriptional regulator